MNDYKYSDSGLELTKGFESLRLIAYPDPGTGGAPWTVGYGHTGDDVFESLVITESQANQWLIEDTDKAADHVRRLVTVELTQNQFDALVDFVFNCGAENLAKSTLLKLVNEKRFEEAAKQFQEWVHAGGRVLPGLVKRRYQEAALFSDN